MSNLLNELHTKEEEFNGIKKKVAMICGNLNRKLIREGNSYYPSYTYSKYDNYDIDVDHELIRIVSISESTVLEDDDRTIERHERILVFEVSIEEFETYLKENEI